MHAVDQRFPRGAAIDSQLVQHSLRKQLLRSEIPSGICAKLRTVAASNNRVNMPWSLFAHAIVTFNRWHRQYHQRLHATITLLLLVRATCIYGVVLHAHPVRGESHNQRNTTGEVATQPRGPRRKQADMGAADHKWHFESSTKAKVVVLCIFNETKSLLQFVFITLRQIPII